MNKIIDPWGNGDPAARQLHVAQKKRHNQFRSVKLTRAGQTSNKTKTKKNPPKKTDNSSKSTTSRGNSTSTPGNSTTSLVNSTVSTSHNATQKKSVPDESNPFPRGATPQDNPISDRKSPISTSKSEVDNVVTRQPIRDEDAILCGSDEDDLVLDDLAELPDDVDYDSIHNAVASIYSSAMQRFEREFTFIENRPLSRELSNIERPKSRHQINDVRPVSRGQNDLDRPLSRELSKIQRPKSGIYYDYGQKEGVARKYAL